MTGIAQYIKSNIDHTISEIFSLYYKDGITINLSMKVIFLQSYLINLNYKIEIFEEVKNLDFIDNIKKFNNFIVEYEAGLENLLNAKFSSNKNYDDLTLMIKSYYLSIYKLMIQNEIFIADIKPEDHICMIGAGSMPISLILLHKLSGAKLLGLDIDGEAVKNGNSLIKLMANESSKDINIDNIQIKNNNDVDFFDYNIFILSVYIDDKKELIDNIIKSRNGKGFTIIDRTTTGFAKYFYNSTSITEESNCKKIGSINSNLITSTLFEYNSFSS